MLGFSEEQENRYLKALSLRGVTLEEQETKMKNLTALAKDGYVKIRAITHSSYLVEGKEGYYNPYEDTWSMICPTP